MAPTARPADSPAAVWKALARRLSPTGKDRYKAFDPETREYKRRQKITDTLPKTMAAVDIYSAGGLTTQLVLDFDAKEHGPAQVEADFARAARWVRDCGGRIVSDRSTSGGRHLIVPLAIGSSATLAEMRQLADQLKARLRTLDPKPTKSTAGCISVPGTRCSGGGYRLLDGPLNEAVAALTERSDSKFLPALYSLLGTLPAPTTPPSQRELSDSAAAQYIDGHDDDQRIVQAYWWNRPIPDDVLHFATHGWMNAAWNTPSEARQAVVTNAVLRGYTRGRIRAAMQPGGPWSALGEAYRQKHGIRADTQFDRDFQTAITFAVGRAHAIAKKSQRKTHRENYTHFSELTLGRELEDSYKAWLGYALAWTDHHFKGTERWSIRDVWQSLAVKAAVAGELREGVPIVGVGGRSISLSTGLLSHKATARALRRTRDMVGAPILLTRRSVGRDPDVYALVALNPDGIQPIPRDRVRLAAVHPAWSRLGRHHRTIYELIVHNKMTRPSEIFAAAKVNERSGHYSLAALAGEGLITRRRGHVSPGPVTLDDIADEQHLDEVFAARQARYKRERAAWHAWLALRDEAMLVTDTDLPDWRSKHLDYVLPHHAEFLASVMADLPPPLDEAQRQLERLEQADSETIAVHADAIALLSRVLGATVVATHSG